MDANGLTNDQLVVRAIAAVGVLLAAWWFGRVPRADNAAESGATLARLDARPRGRAPDELAPAGTVDYLLEDLEMEEGALRIA